MRQYDKDNMNRVIVRFLNIDRNFKEKNENFEKQSLPWINIYNILEHMEETVSNSLLRICLRIPKSEIHFVPEVMAYIVKRVMGM